MPAWEGAEKEDEYFNPRPPRGGRRSRILGDAAQPWISIHAPREGGDDDLDDSPGGTCISIHAPREGGDAQMVQLSGRDRPFQSTPPARGATPIFSLHYCIRIISIHAPREGGDGIYDLLKNALAISIHAPREGGDIII